MQEEKIIHRNIPQMMVIAIWARIMVLLWARGTGKSEGGTAVWVYENAISMPGSVGAIGTDSYKHLRKQILPELEKTWRKLGMKKGKDYWIDQFPPKNLGIPEAIRPISEPENVVFWRNGSATKLFSFNFQSLQQGDSIDYLGVEETKLVNPKRLNEVFPCLRGNEDAEWSWKSCHHSVMLVTDMPDEVDGMWILDYQDMMDEKMIKLILKIQAHISLLEDKLEIEKDKQEQKFIEEELQKLGEKINKYRKKEVFVSYASTLENIHALGQDVIRNLQKILNDNKFRRSVMNELPKQIENCFYHMLSKDKHGYTSLNAKFINSSGDKTKDDCRWDSDLLEEQDLHIAFDYNGNICTAMVGHYDENRKELKFLKNFHLDIAKGKTKRLLRLVVKEIVEYYKYRSNRRIHYYYDNTAVGTDADRDEQSTYKAIVEKELKKGRFDVYCHNVKSTTHKERFEDWEIILSRDDSALFSFLFNIENCREWLFACTHTKTLFKDVLKNGQIEKKFEKDKTEEKKGNIQPIQATHITEAGDTLFVGILQRFSNNLQFFG